MVVVVMLCGGGSIKLSFDFQRSVDDWLLLLLLLSLILFFLLFAGVVAGTAGGASAACAVCAAYVAAHGAAAVKSVFSGDKVHY